MPSLQEAIATFIQLDRSPITNRDYGNCLRRLATAIGPSRDLRLVTLADLIDYGAKLRPTVSQGTYAQYTRIIRGFFTWCAEVGYLEQSPAAGLIARKPPKDPNRQRAIPPDELQRLIDAVRRSARDFAIVMFLADTGCRVGGISRLRISALDLDNHTATLLEKGNRYYAVFFGAETTAALRRWLAKRPVSVEHDYVFTHGRNATPLKPVSIAMMVERVTREVCARPYRPHSIRHAVGHAWAKAGVPVTITQRKLGHANPQMTMQFYYPESQEYLKTMSEENSLIATGRKGSQPPELPPQSERGAAGEEPPAVSGGKIIRLNFG